MSSVHDPAFKFRFGFAGWIQDCSMVFSKDKELYKKRKHEAYLKYKRNKEIEQMFEGLNKLVAALDRMNRPRFCCF